MPYRRFETELNVRPDDIDMNNHVHTSKYLDYYLAARYDQMERCYLMSMDEFLRRGWTWFIKSVSLEFKRQIKITDALVVRTWIDSHDSTDVSVRFEILKKTGMKLAASGLVVNTLVSISTGRAVPIPDEIIRQYTQFTE